MGEKRAQKKKETANYHEQEKQPRKRGVSVWLGRILLLVAVAVFIFATYQLILHLLPYQQGRAINRQLQAKTHLDMMVAGQVTEEEGERVWEDGFALDLEALMATNPDFLGWLRFEEPSIISYPVVVSKDNREYLSMAFDRSYNFLGTIFLDMNNSPDMSDQNNVFHGHHLNVGGEMFSQLNVYQDEQYAKEHPYFYFYTADGYVSIYQVFAFAKVPYTSPHYQLTFTDALDFDAFLKALRTSSFYFLDDVQIAKDAKILTLSTCTNEWYADRYVLHAVLIDHLPHVTVTAESGS